METTTPAVHLDTIGQIALTVSSLEEARLFYRDVLGMQFLFDAGTMTFFQCGAVRLLIGTGEQNGEQGTGAPGGTILYFRIPDIQATHAALHARGVTFLHEPHVVARTKTHDVWLAEFRDPAGNTLALMSEVSRPGEGE